MQNSATNAAPFPTHVHAFVDSNKIRDEKPGALSQGLQGHAAGPPKPQNPKTPIHAL